MAEGEFPEEGELVVCTVHSVKNFGAFVTLDEYGGREGFIHIAEVASGWVKYIRDFVREGQKAVCKVIKIEEAKGQIDLSLKRVTDHQKREKMQARRNVQRSEKLLELALEKAKITPDEWFEKHGNALVEEVGGLYELFEAVAGDPEYFEKRKVKGAWTRGFAEVARGNIAPPSVTIAGILLLSSTGPAGVDDVKEALHQVEKSKGVEVHAIGAPSYRVIVTSEDYKKAEEELKRASDRALATIRSRGGTGEFRREEEKA